MVEELFRWRSSFSEFAELERDNLRSLKRCHCPLLLCLHSTCSTYFSKVPTEALALRCCCCSLLRMCNTEVLQREDVPGDSCYHKLSELGAVLFVNVDALLQTRCSIKWPMCQIWLCFDSLHGTLLFAIICVYCCIRWICNFFRGQTNLLAFQQLQAA